MVFKMRKKIKFGDILEIPTKLGLSYSQFYQYHAAPPNFGALLRVLPGFFVNRPNDYSDLAKSKEVFSTFFPVQTAVNRELVQVAGHAEVPPHAKQFPLFRRGFRNPATGKVDVWRLWDGNKTWQIGSLTDEQLDFPILSIPSFPMLVERLESGWTPRRQNEFIDAARKKNAIGTAPAPAGAVEEMRHYLIFQNRDNAEQAVRKVIDLGFKAGITDLGEGWGVNVLQPDLAPEKIEAVTEQLEKVAAITGGIYDGNQFKVE